MSLIDQTDWETWEMKRTRDKERKLSVLFPIVFIYSTPLSARHSFCLTNIFSISSKLKQLSAISNDGRSARSDWESFIELEIRQSPHHCSKGTIFIFVLSLAISI